MKKELIICNIVIIIVVIGNILTQNHTKQCVETMDQELRNLREMIIEKEIGIKEKVEQVKETWNAMQEILTFYIEHDELEKVETQLFLLSGEIEVELYEDAIPEIEKCMFILEHIADKTSLNVKNIF